MRVARFFERRYPVVSLATIKRALLNEDERLMALALLDYRTASGWPAPSILGERRCVDCHRIITNEGSACEDEDVCRSCLASSSPGGRGTADMVAKARAANVEVLLVNPDAHDDADRGRYAPQAQPQSVNAHD